MSYRVKKVIATVTTILTRCYTSAKTAITTCHESSIHLTVE